MKHLKGLDEKPTSFDDVPPEVMEKMPTFRKLFKAAIGMATRGSGEQAIDLYQVGLKLKLAEPDLSLEDAEFNLLREACNQNAPNWISHYHAQVMMKLKEAEKA